MTIDYPDDIDPECIVLCDALNSLPGIRTVESCCGHGKYEFQVVFEAGTIEALFPIAATTLLSKWKVRVFCTEEAPGVLFILEGPVGPPEMPGGANDFASWVQFGRS